MIYIYKHDNHDYELRFTRFHLFSQIPRISGPQWYNMCIGRVLSPYLAVPGFHPSLIVYCTMHVSNLGLIQWTNAAVLLALTRLQFFGAGRLSDALHACTIRFRQWCTLHGIPQSQPIITVGMLHLSATEAPELTLKAYHGRIFLAFLVTCLRTVVRDNGDPELLLAFEAAQTLSQWHSKLESCGRYLERAEATELQRLCTHFLGTYKVLAHMHASRGSMHWPLRPILVLHCIFLHFCVYMYIYIYSLNCATPCTH